MHKVTAILNPVAGRGAGARLASQIAEQFEVRGLDLDLVTSQAPGHVAQLASYAIAQGSESVIAVGGDGTVNEALNGLIRAGNGQDLCPAALGVLPIGTGNDFAVGAGIPLSLPEAFRIVAQGQTRLVDVGRVCADNEEPLYFGNGVGIGFDAMVNIESRKLRRLRGFLVYLVAVFRTMAFYYYAPAVEIQIDGDRIALSSLMISIMNGYRFGGGFQMTPGAQMDDGLLDLCVTGKISRPQMLAFVPRFLRGTHITDRHIMMRQGRQVVVVSESPWMSHVDGEIYGLGAKRFEMELFPQKLPLIC